MKCKMFNKMMATVCSVATVAGCVLGSGGIEVLADESSTLSLMTATSWNTDALLKGISLYEDTTGNKVEMEVIPDDQISDLIKTRLATNADVPDVIAFHDGPFTSQQIVNYFEPLEGEWIGKLNEEHLDKKYKEKNGEVYRAPYGSLTTLGLIYNKQIMEDNNISLPIMSYTDLIAVCETLKSNGITPMSISNKENWTAQILGLDQNLSGLTAEEYEALKSGQLNYADVESLQKLLSNMVGLRDNGYINEDFMSTTMDMSIEDVATGECAMTPAGAWSYSVLETNFPDAVENVGMIPVPISDDSIYVNINTSSKFFWVTKNGKSGNSELGKDFVNFMMSDETMQAMYEVEPGICPIQGLEVKQNSWEKEMVGYSETIPYAKVIGELSGFSTGDFATPIQQLFGGKSVHDTLECWYDDCVQQNKAARTEGF